MFTVRLSSCIGKESLNCIINVLSIQIYEFFSSQGVLQMQVNLGEACWELGCVCRLLDMHSLFLARASNSLPPLFLMRTPFTFCGFCQFSKLNFTFLANCTACLKLPSSVIYLLTAVSVPAPAFLSLLLFTLCFWWKTVYWICNISAPVVAKEKHHRWLLLTQVLFKTLPRINFFGNPWEFFLQFQPSPCSAVQTFCILLFSADPPWAVESRLAPQGQSAV